MHLQKEYPAFWRGIASFLGLIPDLVDGVDGHEGRWVGFADVVHEPAVLLLVHDGDDLPADSTVVGAVEIIVAGAAVELVEDEPGDLVVFRGQDADLALDVDAEDEMIQHHAAEVGTQDAEHHGLL